MRVAADAQPGRVHLRPEILGRSDLPDVDESGAEVISGDY